MRQSGPYLVGDLHIVVDNTLIITEADKIASKVEERITEEFGRVIDIKVIVESDEAHDRHTRAVQIKK